MYTAIKNFCDSHEHGLFLLDMPTGYGKTYQVLKYIYEASMDSKNETKKFIFITTRKNNLPEQSLKQWFIDSGNETLFNEKFLFLDSNTDCVLKNLSAEVVASIPETIRSTQECRTLLRDAAFLLTTQKNKDVFVRTNFEKTLETFRTEVEPSFNAKIRSILAAEYPQIQDRIHAVETDSNWRWLEKLYPAVATRNKQIIFMSMDKFLVRNTTIVEPSYLIANAPFLENSIVFIDEFDATKDTILQRLIDDGLKKAPAYIEMFLEIFSSLTSRVFPAKLTDPAPYASNPEYYQKLIDQLREKAQAIYEDCSLTFTHKTFFEESEIQKTFLFQDYRLHSIFSEAEKRISIRRNTSEKVNKILFSTPVSQFSNDVYYLLSRIRGYISYFQTAVCRQQNRRTDRFFCPARPSFELRVQSFVGENRFFSGKKRGCRLS